jgi:RimJ/RimL family protein N-acetyltransferase
MMRCITSKSILIRLVEEDDAEFILSLRLSQNLNAFLSKVNSDVNGQRLWIRDYKKDESKNRQFYFIVERLDGIPCGTVRLYDFRGDSFSWGSWILNGDKTRYAAIESAFLVYRFGFNILGFKKSHFEVMKGNDRVIAFHEKMGAVRVSEDVTNIYFEIHKDQVEIKRDKFKEKIL